MGSLYCAKVISPVRWIFSFSSAVIKSPLFLHALTLVAYQEKVRTARLVGLVSVILILVLFGIGKVSFVHLEGMMKDTSVISP